MKTLILRFFFFTVNASQAGAGNLEIIVAVNGKNVPNYVQSEGNAKFRVNFKPQEAAMHSLSVRFNGEPVPGIKINYLPSHIFLYQTSISHKMEKETFFYAYQAIHKPT